MFLVDTRLTDKNAGVDWSALGDNALVVDVGGGIGAQSLTLSKNCPNLRFIVQDREAVMKDAKKESTSSLLCCRQKAHIHL